MLTAAVEICKNKVGSIHRITEKHPSIMMEDITKLKSTEKENVQSIKVLLIIE